MKINAFQIYGDNLGECHKFCELLVKYGQETGLVFQKFVGPVDRPIYLFKSEELEIGLLPCGRYEDWNRSRRPFIGYEDPDIIVCHATKRDDVGKPVLGLEFNDAIEAGNNAWQRFPRIAQSAEKGVAFIYHVPICDAEIKEGEIRSFRHPNAIIQLAQLVLMAEHRTISLTTLTDNPWVERGLKDGKVCPKVSWKEGERNLAQVSSSIIVKRSQETVGVKDFSAVNKSLKESFGRVMIDMLRHISFFIDCDFSVLKGHPAFDESNFPEAIEAWWKKVTGGEDIPSHYQFYDWKKEDFEKAKLPFQKVTSTASTFQKTLNKAIRNEKVNNKLAYALSYKKGANEIALVFNPKEFVALLQKAYPSLEKKILAHLSESSEPIVLLPIAGYVMDTGGPAFSRPDKGLVGLMRTVFGRGHFSRRLVLLYSDLVPDGWKDAVLEAKKEEVDTKSAQTNNLWREIVRFGTALIVDKYGSGMLI